MKKTQTDAVIEVMERNGGYATFGYLYQHVLKVGGVPWTTKTPFASIRRIVQLDSRFFRVKPGLWALESHRDRLPFPTDEIAQANEAQQEEFSHSYFQGLIVEIGNFKQLVTYVPPQDKNNQFLNKPLSTVATAPKIFDFCYPEILRSAKTVDVIWFNQRKMPDSFIEVEHSTDIYNSLRKFGELQDFSAKFVIVAPEVRKAEFDQKIASTVFRDVRDKVKFWGYESVSKLHTNLAESIALAERL